MFLVAAVVAKATAESPPVPSLRLGNEARPTAYSAELVVVPERSNFTGQITIDLVLAEYYLLVPSPKCCLRHATTADSSTGLAKKGSPPTLPPRAYTSDFVAAAVRNTIGTPFNFGFV